MIVLIYLLKLVVCSALFFGYYYFFLRNKSMHQYNRFYILFSVTLSIVLPLIKLPLLSTGHDQEQTITKTLQGIAFGGWEKEVVITAKHGFLNSLITAQHVIIALYITGFLVMVFPVVRSLAYIRSISRKHKAREVNNIQFYETTEPGTPFSFFNTVFWNNEIPIETEKGQQILRHELYHIKQKHSYDILFMQLACSLLWFNPFCYMLNKELKVIHEFLADEYAASATDKHEYAKLLVMQSISPKQVFITNQFFYNQIKRRITMILQSNNSRYSNIRKLMAVPVVALIFCACSVKNKDVEPPVKTVQTATDKVVEKKDSAAVEASVKEVNGPIEERIKRVKLAPDYDEIFTKLEIEAEYPGGAGAWMRYLNKTFRYPLAAQENEIQGTIIIQFIVDKEGNVSDVEAIKGTTEGGLREEAVRVIRNSGKWLPGIQNGRKVKSYKKQPLTFKLQAE